MSRRNLMRRLMLNSSRRTPRISSVIFSSRSGGCHSYWFPPNHQYSVPQWFSLGTSNCCEDYYRWRVHPSSDDDSGTRFHRFETPNDIMQHGFAHHVATTYYQRGRGVFGLTNNPLYQKASWQILYTSRKTFLILPVIIDKNLLDVYYWMIVQRGSCPKQHGK